jgi:Protein of unknown function (DUF3147)
MVRFFEVTAMRIQINPSPLFKTKWYEYATRFVLGGLITVGAGLIAEKWGPSVGGLFLAFPAIFPASATLIESMKNNPSRLRDWPARSAPKMRLPWMQLVLLSGVSASWRSLW